MRIHRDMKRLSVGWGSALGAAMLFTSTASIASEDVSAFFAPAIQALKSKRLVFVPDPHGNQDIANALADFYGRLEIPERGGVTVLAEFINPVHQDLLDRYFLSLEDMPVTELSQAWFDTSDIGTWRRDDPDVLRILSVIRGRNQELPRSRRIRVVGGNAPIDWRQVKSREDLSRTPLKNRYAIAVIDHLMTECPSERMIVQYGTYHVSRRFLPHFSRPDQPAFFYMGFIDPSNTCKGRALSPFATTGEAEACIGGDPTYRSKRDAVAEAMSSGTGLAFQFDLDPSKYGPDVAISPDPELERRRAILKSATGEKAEALTKANVQPQTMPTCTVR
jgi:hypothetical protein